MAKTAILSTDLVLEFDESNIGEITILRVIRDVLDHTKIKSKFQNFIRLGVGYALYQCKLVTKEEKYVKIESSSWAVAKVPYQVNYNPTSPMESYTIHKNGGWFGLNYKLHIVTSVTFTRITGGLSPEDMWAPVLNPKPDFIFPYRLVKQFLGFEFSDGP
ncbi:hypothetical protein [La Joya virus]|uniref:Uncharacterized protein n=1 Tax=La Joya virus TaxID=1272946 RepID=A0A0D3R103_9RHAB|nr:hypothetical protein [La Joya virus]AJR28303.1 hypothetical protein [La Joya virus]